MHCKCRTHLIGHQLTGQLTTANNNLMTLAEKSKKPVAICFLCSISQLLSLNESNVPSNIQACMSVSNQIQRQSLPPPSFAKHPHDSQYVPDSQYCARTSVFRRVLARYSWTELIAVLVQIRHQKIGWRTNDIDMLCIIHPCPESHLEIFESLCFAHTVLLNHNLA